MQVFGFEASKVLSELKDAYERRTEIATERINDYFRESLPQWMEFVDEFIVKCVEEFRK